ncbi:MAG: hypothetical protein AB4290_08065 [Spirulina sp.]
MVNQGNIDKKDNKVNIAIAITPRSNEESIAKLQDWLNYIRNGLELNILQHFGENITIVKCVVCIPKRPKISAKTRLDDIIGRTPQQYWCVMEPGFIGSGDTMRGACFFAFQGCQSLENIPVDYVLHLPIDVDFGNPHPNDIQNKLWKLLEPVNSASRADDLPDLVIGDYNPMLWHNDNQTSESYLVKVLIEEHVKEQLHHYFPDKVVDRLSIKRLRSEFFLINKKLFGKVKATWKRFPFDPMPIVLHFADSKGFKIKKVNLGNFYEQESGEKNIRDQILRTASQISNYWLQLNSTRSLIGEARKLSEGWHMALENIENILHYIN